MTKSAEIIARDVDPIKQRTLDLATELAAIPGALLPVLHAVQDEFGYIPHASVAVIAEVLNLSRADVHGVITFYHHFRQQTPTRHQLHICRAEACQSMGAEQLIAQTKTMLNIDIGESCSDGSLSLDAIYCLGNCAAAPAIMIDENVYGRVDIERLKQLINPLLADNKS